MKVDAAYCIYFLKRELTWTKFCISYFVRNTEFILESCYFPCHIEINVLSAEAYLFLKFSIQ